MSQLSAVLRAALQNPGAVRDDAATCAGAASDASHFLLTPEIVVAPSDAAEVGRLLRATADAGAAVVFRSGGTSLSGQAGTDRVLVDVRRHFRGCAVLDDGKRVRVQPGTTVRAVNDALAPYGRRLGPDPASADACTVGGVIANNAAGLACGTAANSYATIDGLVAVLPSGTVVDTLAPDADDRLRSLEPDLYTGIARLRDRVRGNGESVRRLTAQFAMKNTMGYSLNAFLDFSKPVDLFTHLLVGSEGTLAFVAEATLRTVPVHPCAATGVLLFANVAEATAALPDLIARQPAIVELLDAASLRIAQADARATGSLRALRIVEHAALLVEFQSDSPDALADALADPAAAVLALTADPTERADLWRMRQGLYAAIAGSRAAGTVALLEDAVVPPAALSQLCDGLTGLFAQHGYDGAALFGHAKDANVHFMLTDRFDRPETVARYRRFTTDMVDLVLGLGGSLKAEHGTGRAMAPYVRRQFGDELYAVMRELKGIFDPQGVLAPGVILDEDPLADVRHLKTVPSLDASIDRCVECGYCEPPFAAAASTPRREIARRRAGVPRPPGWVPAAPSGEVAALSGEVAAPSGEIAAVSCPVGIDVDAVMGATDDAHATPRPR